MTRTHNILFSIAATTLIGCATATPSTQLVDARTQYHNARNGVAYQYEPELVHDASEALREAEAAHDRKPGAHEEQHLAYIADRKARLAQSEGRTRQAQERTVAAHERREQVLVAQRDRVRSDLESTRDQLGATQDDLHSVSGELGEERAARQDLERELDAAMASLQAIAKVKAAEKETVITLSGEVLFRTDESSLLPTARDRLRKVAEVLRKQDTNKTFIVEGHTDSQGTEEHNRKLSESRALAVRSFLIDEGVPQDRIRAVGEGESEPIADNKSPEGRANNRRVEIIVSDAKT